MKKQLLLCLLCLIAHCQSVLAYAIPGVNFWADESKQTYWSEGFDSPESLSKWTMNAASQENIFQLVSVPTLSPHTSFQTIDPTSQSSLNIQWSKNYQNITLTSPKIEYQQGSELEFYVYFSGIWLFWADWSVEVVNGDYPSVSLGKVSGFAWAQENAYTGPSWVRFTLPISEGNSSTPKYIKIILTYKGTEGDDVAFDGFKLTTLDNSDKAFVTVGIGEPVHFHCNFPIEDQSLYEAFGDIELDWNFPGADEEVSMESNPVVTYSQAGLYSVELKVSLGNYPNFDQTVSRTEYVHVLEEMPKAIIGLPEEGYLSPFRAVFIPVGVPVTFHDLSTHHPNERSWTFQGTDIESSSDEEPVVTYLTPGTYSLGLSVSNSKGTDQDIMYYAVQAGGAQYVWNIAPEENQSLAGIQLGFYGNYAGSNWLSMDAFAERYPAPLAPATVDSVAIYFNTTTTVSPNANITVAVQSPDADGLPGEVLASTSLKASQLRYDRENVVETVFHFDAPVTVEGEFFVSVSGIPHESTDTSYDDISILCCRRGNVGDKNTAYHYFGDEKKWYANIDDPLSMAICPIVNYGLATAIETVDARQSESVERIFDLNGRPVTRRQMGKGLYLSQGRKILVK